jgi:hypothetical protein
VAPAGSLLHAALQRRRKDVMNTGTIAPRANSRKPGSNLPPSFTIADAPPAASNRALRRLWMAEANRILRRTGNPDAARRAAAEILVAALDCDAFVLQIARVAGEGVPVNLPILAKRRGRNRDGAADRVAEMVLAGGRP